MQNPLQQKSTKEKEDAISDEQLKQLPTLSCPKSATPSEEKPDVKRAKINYVNAQESNESSTENSPKPLLTTPSNLQNNQPEREIIKFLQQQQELRAQMPKSDLCIGNAAKEEFEFKPTNSLFPENLPNGSVLEVLDVTSIPKFFSLSVRMSDENDLSTFICPRKQFSTPIKAPCILVKDDFDSFNLGFKEYISVGNLKRVEILNNNTDYCKQLAQYLRKATSMERFNFFRVRELTEFPSGTIFFTGAMEIMSYIRSQKCSIYKPLQKLYAVHFYLENGESGFLKLDRSHGLLPKDFQENRAIQYTKAETGFTTLAFGIRVEDKNKC